MQQAQCFTAGLYRKMGITAPVAHDVDSYASVAVRIATNSAFRSTLSKEILQRKHHIFEDQDSVAEWEAFLLNPTRHTKSLASSW
jgi:predicted O-linked N-acetylglucosamine transferase (SPINDLY family)